MKMRHPFESEEAAKTNDKIFETIYYAALRSSLDIAKVEGPYETFKGSPASQGILQFDMWNKSASNDYDWNGLKEDIKKHGIRNSLLVAPMPTASTSQILGNDLLKLETNNLFNRK